MTRLAHARLILGDRNLWLVVVFLSYVAMIMGFALLYHRVYTLDHLAFSFASDVAASQREQVGSFIASEIPRLTTVRNALVDAARLAGSGAFQLDLHEPRVHVQSGLHVAIGVSGSAIAGGGAVWNTIRVYDRAGNQIASFSPPGEGWPSDPAQVARIIQTQADNVRDELVDLERRRASLGGTAPDVWGFWDFVYFSTITQGTVGYGDILPNNTLVRMIAVCQVLLGYLFLVVILNLVVRVPSPGTKSDDASPFGKRTDES